MEDNQRPEQLFSSNILSGRAIILYMHAAGHTDLNLATLFAKRATLGTITRRPGKMHICASVTGEYSARNSPNYLFRGNILLYGDLCCEFLRPEPTALAAPADLDRGGGRKFFQKRGLISYVID